jgi:hypothetical protein
MCSLITPIGNGKYEVVFSERVMSTYSEIILDTADLWALKSAVDKACNGLPEPTDEDIQCDSESDT